MLDGFKTETVAANGTEIFVRSAGAGDPLLLIHGFPQTGGTRSLRLWRNSSL